MSEKGISESQRLELFLIGSLGYVHIFLPEKDQEAATKRMPVYSTVIRDVEEYLIRRDK